MARCPFLLLIYYISSCIEGGHINCRDSNDCVSETKSCTDNEDCTIDCAYYQTWHGGYGGCEDSTLNCPDNAKCTIMCDVKEACDSAVINAQTSTELILTCSDQWESCKDLDIYCPRHTITNSTTSICIISGDNSNYDGMYTI